MLRALSEAHRSSGQMGVGAVIALGNTVLTTGYKDEIEGQHAEQIALTKAQESGMLVEGADLYTTLEPCANSETRRVPCAELIANAGLGTVYIGIFDLNPQVYRLGWEYLRNKGIRLKDFPADLREQARQVSENFMRNFWVKTGAEGGAKFDYTINGGFFTIEEDDIAGAASWVTKWTERAEASIYAYGGSAGKVALARYAREFDEIDDPDALDYGGHTVPVQVGEIAVFRNSHGHALCKVCAIKITSERGGGAPAFVKIKWRIRRIPNISHRII